MSKEIQVINPATLEVEGSVPDMGVEELDNAVTAAAEAQKSWGALSMAQRGAALSAGLDQVEPHAGELAELLTREQGKPIAMSQYEVESAIAHMRYFASVELGSTHIPQAKHDATVFHRPMGVVAGIVPWNFPINMYAWKVGPGLMAGNGVLLKPAPTTPLSSVRFTQLLQGALPKGILQAITGGNDLGAAVVSHPGIAKIAFTGSTATGVKIMRSAADSLKRLTLELGGNDPAIILPDSDLEEIAAKIFNFGFVNAGQTCIAIKRVYVHESQHDGLVDALVDRAKGIVIGNGLDPATEMGPIHSEAQRTIVTDMLADARSRGGNILCGGEPIAELPGWFLRPAIVTGLPDDADLVAKEQFGPALPILSYSSVDEAIDRANATDLGLGASVWGRDQDEAVRYAARLTSGTTWVNNHCALDINVPFGGRGMSGIGTELGGEEAVADFAERQVISIARW
jgi:acyl-CoA reductase-like NAD-dependent aldehyde dehydrogenase